MTSEIEKMYENIGIKPLCQIPDKYCGLKNVYEDFTAEKQIELIKWLTQKKRREITISFEFLGNDFHFSTDILTCSFEKTFEEALAKLVNNLWHYLTEEEKEQIRGILK